MNNPFYTPFSSEEAVEVEKILMADARGERKLSLIEKGRLMRGIENGDDAVLRALKKVQATEKQDLEANECVCCQYLDGRVRYTWARRLACKRFGSKVAESNCAGKSRAACEGRGGGGGLGGSLNDICRQVPCSVKATMDDGTELTLTPDDLAASDWEVVEVQTTIRPIKVDEKET